VKPSRLGDFLRCTMSCWSGSPPRAKLLTGTDNDGPQDQFEDASHGGQHRIHRDEIAFEPAESDVVSAHRRAVYDAQPHAAAARAARVVRMIIPRSEPEPQTGDEAHAAGALARAAREVGALAEFPFVDDAEIGRKFPAELVAQAQAGIDIGEPGADHAGEIGLAVEVERRRSPSAETFSHDQDPKRTYRS
jgi:hypothetical protein